jgi:hypothetical protein
MKLKLIKWILYKMHLEICTLQLGSLLPTHTSIFLVAHKIALYMIIEGKDVPVHAMKEHGGIQLQIHSFLTSASGVGVFSASFSGGFTRNVNAPCTHCIRSLIGHTSCLDALEMREVSCLFQVTSHDV